MYNMTENYTKWYITACFRNEEGAEFTETRTFWSKVAETEAEAIKRYRPPTEGVDMLEVYGVTKDEDTDEELDAKTVSEVPDSDIESETSSEDIDDTIIHA